MKRPQTTDTVLMVQPSHARSNPDTAEDNLFQVDTDREPTESEIKQIRTEFLNYVALLEEAGVNVVVFEQKDKLDTPDAHFPNNWFSTHRDGTCVIYPMMAKNRRLERRKEIVDYLSKKYKTILDLTSYEGKSQFLEGTGSLVLDRENRVAYVALSERTDKDLLDYWCKKLNYDAVCFTATEGNGLPIYHTNVMCSIGKSFSYICLEAIENPAERKGVEETIAASGRELVSVSREQIHMYCGNILRIRSKSGEPLLVLSETARNGLTNEQVEILSKYGRFIVPDLKTIELFGGGSARCMLAELF